MGETKRVKRPSPAQMRAAADMVQATVAADALHREALDNTAAWLRHEAAKGGAS